VRDSSAYEIDNVPYYVNNVSKGDLVSVASIDGEIFAAAVVARGGHSTLRVFVDEPRRQKAIAKALTKLGASCSITDGLSLFAVDIAPEIDFLKIDSYLEGCADGEHIAYEDACLQHQGIDTLRSHECVLRTSIPVRLN
jgi:hypothetical protein